MPDHVPASATPLVYYVAQSLDGFVADRDDALDWLLQFGFDTFQQHYDEFFAGVGAIIMGASTYRWLAATGEAWPYPGLPCWVLTHRTLPPMGGAEGVITATDVPAVARAARAAAGDRSVWVVGGGQTAAQFAEHGELDELRVTVMPITLGDGAPPAAPRRPCSALAAQRNDRLRRRADRARVPRSDRRRCGVGRHARRRRIPQLTP